MKTLKKVEDYLKIKINRKLIKFVGKLNKCKMVKKDVSNRQINLRIIKKF